MAISPAIEIEQDLNVLGIDEAGKVCGIQTLWHLNEFVTPLLDALPIATVVRLS